MAKPIFFLHIPKTAGTSVADLLESKFEPSGCYRITDTHKPLSQLRDEIEIALLEGAEFLWGHVGYEAIEPFVNDLRIMTLLREPIDRIISVYRFWNSRQVDLARSHAERLAIQYAKSSTFSSFIRSQHPVIKSTISNEQSHTIGGRSMPRGRGELLRQAMSNIETMSFGIVEELDDSLRLMSSELEVNIRGAATLNPTPSTIPRPHLSQQDLLEAVENNNEDFLLYRYAAMRHKEKLADLEVRRLFVEVGGIALSDIGEVKVDGSFVWTPDMRLVGDNWHEREKLGGNGYYRFTASPESVIYLPNPFRSSLITLVVTMAFFNNVGRVATGGPVDVAELLRFRIGSEPCQAEVRDGLEGRTDYVLRFSSGSEILKLQILSNYGIEPSVFGSLDRRNLAAAVSAITLKRI